MVKNCPEIKYKKTQKRVRFFSLFYTQSLENDFMKINGIDFGEKIDTLNSGSLETCCESKLKSRNQIHEKIGALVSCI